MNHYYAEFHARDRVERFHREAYDAVRASQAPRRRGDHWTNRDTKGPLSAALALFIAIVVALLVALPANA